MKPRPAFDPRMRRLESSLQMRRHPVLKSDIHINHHRKAKRHADCRRLGEHSLESLRNRRLGRRVSRHLNRLCILKEKRQYERPQYANAAEDPERNAPALTTLAGHPSRKTAATNDSNVKPQLENRNRSCSRFLMELRNERSGGGIVECLAKPVQDAIAQYEKPYSGNETRKKNTKTEYEYARGYHPFAV